MTRTETPSSPARAARLAVVVALAGLSSRPRGRRAFTLTELLIVIGLIVLLVALAVPAFNLISGTRSIESAENQISAFVGATRAEAIGLQEKRGVFLFVDPGSDRLTMVQVYYPPNVLPTNDNGVVIDLFPNRDEVQLPLGVGLRAVPNGNPSATNNPSGWDQFACIMFDGDGRLVQDPIKVPDPRTANGNALGRRLSPPSAGATTITNTLKALTSPPPNVLANIGFVLYDKPGFADQEARPSLEQNQWLLDNAVPILVNRYNGTLMRGQ